VRARFIEFLLDASGFAASTRTPVERVTSTSLQRYYLSGT